MKINAEEKQYLSRILKTELARRKFWYYCHIREPEFYTDNRWHLKSLCETLENLYYQNPMPDGKIYRNLIINMPPQHGKTRTLVNFTDWVLGKNNQERIIAVAYGDEQALDYSKFARDAITQQRIDEKGYVFSDIFPETKLKYGSQSKTKWALDGQHFNYLGVGINGSVTGKGATILIFDDLVKNMETALNEEALQKIWMQYSGTFLSRVSAKGGAPLQVMCMTRWAKQDPCGKLLEEEPKEWYVLKFEAVVNNKMLCDDLLSHEAYLKRKRLTPNEIFLANYHQEPIDIQGRLYANFKTYKDLPRDKEGNFVFDRIASYTDTADQGSDYLASGIFLEYRKAAYILDIYYTKDPMEITEPETARRLSHFRVNLAEIESNSGGRGFARNVKRELVEKFNNNNTVIKWFHQSKNKNSRIYSNSAAVQENIYFPVDWDNRWPEFHHALTIYLKEGKNKHDDAPDLITGIIEMMNKGKLEFA